MKNLLSNSSPHARRNFFLIMKLKIFIILITAFQITANAYSQEPRLNLSLKNASIEDVLKAIQSQCDYEFFYAHEEINSKHTINLNLENASLDEVLMLCFENSGLNYEIVDKVIVIKPVSKLKNEVSQTPVPKIKITGKVTSIEDGLGLPGVTIMIKGTTSGVTTDRDGNYTIEVPDANAILAFSFIGFEDQEIAVMNNTVINISMKTSLSELEEVIVTALGTTVKVDETGSTSSIVNADNVKKAGSAGLIDALAGQASGVKINKSSGDPGSGSSIVIRGTNTISGASQPLIIIDGMPVSNDNIGGVTVTQQSRLDDINAKDIESVQILKGASAAALWGSRAANGVIVITTKNGTMNQKPVVEYSFTQSFDQASVFEPLQDKYGQGKGGVWAMNTNLSWGDKIADRSGAADDVNVNGGSFISNTTGNTHYLITKKNSKETYVESNRDLVFRTGSFAQHNFSITGGGEKTAYFLSFENLDQNGIVRNYDYHRKNLRLNTKTQLYDWLTLDSKITYANTKSNRTITAGETTNGVLIGLYRSSPDFDMSDYIGTYVAANGTVYPNRQRMYYNAQIGQSAAPSYTNPLWAIYEQQSPNNVDRFIINPELKIYPTEWLKFIIRGGLDYYNDVRSEFYPIGSSSSARGVGLWTQTDIRNKEINFDAIAIATHDLNKDVKLEATFGVNYNDRNRFMDVNTLSPFAVDSRLYTSDLNPDKSASTWNTTQTQIRSNRGFGILNFGIFNQLFVTVSGAVEAASTIKGTFFYPSVDLAWQFTDLVKSDALSFGKLRFAWGKVGIQPAPYRFYTLAAAGYADFGGSYTLSTTKGNLNLRPEIKTEWEIGTNLRFLKNKIEFGLTYYKNQIKDILFAVKTNPSSGYTYNYKNAAVIENKGFELDLSGKVIEQKDLRLTVSANFNNNKNLVVDIAGAETVDIGGTSKAVKGYPMSSFYIAGSLRDENNNLILDANGYPQLDTKARVLGDPNPDWRGGIGFQLNYKNFDLSVLFEHSQGGDFLDRTRLTLYGFGQHVDVSNEVTIPFDMPNVASVNGTIKYHAGDVVRGNLEDFGGGLVILDEAWYNGRGGGLGFSHVNDFFVEDATWTKLRNVTLGYTFKKLKVTSKMTFSSVRLSVTGRDLILWTKLVGVDPDSNYYGVSNVSGMNYFNNPGTRSVLFNLQVTI
ncbi:MAG: SusC/RagA family TonB-linked outer membrane protein [Bacteroidetes bacterium HGW-Bacteroidetes-17]|jgi:TonB-linked SusC/RagA family outer membrane protein|nr:MAG: SusC/RagA family TonB-linked outer membrane protein [Bacteroidetes bacterium HGW-Bacteroidetes-17]